MPTARTSASRSLAPPVRGCWSKKRPPWSRPATSANGCRARLPPSRGAVRCTSSKRAAIRGSRSIFPKTTGGHAPTSCPRSPTSTRRPNGAGRCSRQRTPPAVGEPCTMYERFHNLRERPFSLSPDPDYLYPSRVHTEALNYLRYGIEGHAGFVVITGEIGSGKTTLLQTALRSLDKRTATARLVNTALDARELIEAIMLDFGLEPETGASK